MDCCTRIAKFILCLTNFFIFVIGSVFLILGLWIITDKYNFCRVTKLDELFKNVEVVPENTVLNFSNSTFLDHTAYVLVAIGGVIFIISFLGYCGSLQENRLFLTSYGIFLILIFILQIASIILIVVFKKEANNHIMTGLKSTISRNYTLKDYSDPVTISWDLVMSHLQCCGLNNYTDFLDAKKFTSAAREEGIGRKIPEACCFLQDDDIFSLLPVDDNCVISPTTKNSYLFKGCYRKIIDMVNGNLNIVFGCLVGLGAAQFVAIVFAFCICKSAGLDGREAYYHYYK